jgi:hypothetical protein
LRQDPELNMARSLTFRILKDPPRLSQGMIRIETRDVSINDIPIKVND